MYNEIIDLDLDYFNVDHEHLLYKKTPIEKLNKMLLTLDQETPCSFHIEHEEILHKLKRRSTIGISGSNVTIYHIDQHHDFYGDEPPPSDKFVDCGNFCYNIPLRLYDNFVWVTETPRSSDICSDWNRAQKWLDSHKKTVSKVRSWDWDERRVASVFVTVSPDYSELGYHYNAMIQLIADYFGTSDVPCPFNRFHDKPKNWGFRKRITKEGVKHGVHRK
jgi:hypothetical protein